MNELLGYKRYSRECRKIISNTWAREIMYRQNAEKVSNLLVELQKIREFDTQREAKSNFWYSALNYQPVAWSDKIQNIESFFPGTMSILSNHFWHLIFNVPPSTFRQEKDGTQFKGPAVSNKSLIILSNAFLYPEEKADFSDTDIEIMYSIDGLSGLLGIHYENLYQNRSTTHTLYFIYKVFLITFAMRYQLDFVWPVFFNLREHLREYGSPMLPEQFDEIKNEEMLRTRANKFLNARRDLVNSGASLRDKLLCVAKADILSH